MRFQKGRRQQLVRRRTRSAWSGPARPPRRTGQSASCLTSFALCWDPVGLLGRRSVGPPGLLHQCDAFFFPIALQGRKGPDVVGPRRCGCLHDAVLPRCGCGVLPQSGCGTRDPAFRNPSALLGTLLCLYGLRRSHRLGKRPRRPLIRYSSVPLFKWPGSFSSCYFWLTLRAAGGARPVFWYPGESWE